MGIIKAKDLVHEYIRRDEEGNVESIQTALDKVSLDVKKGDFIAVLGHNGSGKSTVLKIITGEITPDNGFIAIPQGRRVGYISQLAEAPEGALVEGVLRMAFAEVQAVSAEIEQIQCQMDAGEHSEALLRRYDGILVLKNGTIAESGTYDELLAKKGYFCALCAVET